MAREQPDEVLAELEGVPDDHYMAAQARLIVGQVEMRQHRLRFAEQAIRAAIRLDPSLVQAHRELIFIYGLQLRRAELSAEFLALSLLSNLVFDDLYNWGLLRSESWEPPSAAWLLMKCVAADPGDHWSRVALSENDRRMGLLDEAEADLAGVAPDAPEAIAAHVRIALDRNEEDRAEHLLDSGPRDHPLLAGLRGRLALSRREFPAALRQFRIAYDSDPDGREAISGLIAALVAVGETETADPLRETAAKREHFRSLIQRAGTSGTGSDPELPRLLGDSCTDLHRYDEACGWYKLAIARDPLDSRAQQGLFRLRAAPRDGPRSTLRNP